MHQRETKSKVPAREPLPSEAVELISAQLRVIGEPNRIRLLELLNKGEATVQELSDELATTHQNVSKHLRVLFGAGMVKRTPEGPAVRYAITDWTGWWLIEQLAQGLSVRLEEQRELLQRH
jgi:ArsR family transcriptional regulator